MKFSERLKLEKQFHQWRKRYAETNDVMPADTPASFLVFLEQRGLIKKYKICPQCNGKGDHTGFPNNQDCYACNGTGVEILKEE